MPCRYGLCASAHATIRVWPGAGTSGKVRPRSVLGNARGVVWEFKRHREWHAQHKVGHTMVVGQRRGKSRLLRGIVNAVEMGVGFTRLLSFRTLSSNQETAHEWSFRVVSPAISGTMV